MLAALLSTSLPVFGAPLDGVADDAPEETSPPAAPPMNPGASPGSSRSYRMEVNARGRYLWVPGSVLDSWYERHDTSGDTIPDRPNVAAYAMGLEFVAKDDKANGIFYAEYISSLIKEGYWDDVEDANDPPDDADGSYIRPDKFGLIVVGADYARDIKANPWFSVLIGGGLGVAVKTGSLVEWDPGEVANDGDNDNTDPNCGPAPSPAYERALALGCADDGPVRVPPVLPMVDLNLGVRFTLSERATIRVEGGLHDVPYLGGALGITF